MSLLPKLNFPTYNITLPTSKTDIRLRPMIQKDEKILLMAKESKDPSDILDAIKQVVTNCTVSESASIDTLGKWVDKLPIIDLEFAFIKLRSVSIGNIAKVAYIDGEDNETRDFDVDLEKVVVTNIDTWPVIVVSDDISIELRYPPASLYSDKNFLHAEGQKVIDLLIQSAVATIINKGDRVAADAVTPEELSTFLESLPVPVYAELTKCVASLPHLEYVITYTNKLGNERTITLSSLNDFFTFA